MKHLLKFTDGPKLTRLVELSMRAPERKPVIAQQVTRLMKRDGITEDAAYDLLFMGGERASDPGPDVPVGLWFVHDQGIYLMTNAVWEGESPGVVYAKGYAEGDPDWWERSREAVGGDDFCEFIEVNASWPHPIGAVLIEMDGPEMAIEIRGVPR